jgi:hypothetical protein
MGSLGNRGGELIRRAALNGAIAERASGHEVAMALVPRLLAPLCVLAYLPLACSSDDGATIKTPAPPSAGSSAGGSANGGTAGTSPTGGSGGGTAGTAAGGGSGVACAMTPDCKGTGFFCKKASASDAMGMCACSAEIPDACGAGDAAACVNKKSDPDHCGDCDTKCDAGATCVDSKCTPKPVELLAKGAGCGAMRLAIQGANLYWVEPMTGKVRSMPLGGGAAVDVATAQASPSQIAADATGVYWIVDGAAGVGTSKVMKKALPLAAGEPDVLATSTTADKILGIAVHGGKLYYTLVNDVHQISTDKAVSKDIIVGTATNFDPPAKIEGIPHGVGANDMMVAWTDVGDRNGVEGDDVLEETDMPLTDMTGYVELAQSVGGLKYDIAVDATYAYWLDGPRFVHNKLTAVAPVPDAAIMESPKAAEFTTFAINATNVYAGNADGLILRHSLIPPMEGMDPVEAAPIARDQMAPNSVVVDATKVYWATSDCAIRATDL